MLKKSIVHPCRRRATMYVAVLGCAMVVTVLGVSAILVTRVEGRVMRGSADLASARSLALSSVDMGLFAMYADVNWRTTKVQGTWKSGQAAGDGTIALAVADPVDGVLSDTKWEPVTFTGTGNVREARYLLEATTVAQPLPLPALNTCLHTGGKVTVNLLKNITVSGAPLSMNGSINGPGTITGNVEAVSLGLLPIVIGTSTIPSSVKEMPDAGVFAMYKSLSTQLAVTGTVNGQSFVPTSSNPDGVYFIDATSSNLTITGSRIVGTLLVHCPAGRKLVLQNTVSMRSARSDYPALIVEGDLDIDLNSSSTPTFKVQTTDPADTNEVVGLVHATGALSLSKTSKVNGVIIVGGNVSVSGTPQLTHNPNLYAHPPMGYVTYAMQIAYGSWHRVISP